MTNGADGIQNVALESGRRPVDAARSAAGCFGVTRYLRRWRRVEKVMRTVGFDCQTTPVHGYRPQGDPAAITAGRIDRYRRTSAGGAGPPPADSYRARRGAECLPLRASAAIKYGRPAPGARATCGRGANGWRTETTRFAGACA